MTRRETLDAISTDELFGPIRAGAQPDYHHTDSDGRRHVTYWYLPGYSPDQNDQTRPAAKLTIQHDKPRDAWGRTGPGGYRATVDLAEFAWTGHTTREAYTVTTRNHRTVITYVPTPRFSARRFAEFTDHARRLAADPPPA